MIANPDLPTYRTQCRYRYTELFKQMLGLRHSMMYPIPRQSLPIKIYRQKDALSSDLWDMFKTSLSNLEIMQVEKTGGIEEYHFFFFFLKKIKKIHQNIKLKYNLF